MPFNNPQWKRHQATLVQRDGSVYVVCERCRVVLPLTLFQGQVACIKEDRLFLGDIPTAEDCHAV